MPTPPDGFPRSLCPPPPLRPRTAGARADPPFPLTCPPELRRRAPAPARPAPAPQPQDPRVQAAVAPREPSRRPPSPEVFHLTSAFAASQMLKIPRHLSPGAYQGAEEGGRRTGGWGFPLRSRAGRRVGREGAGGGGWPAGAPAPGARPSLFARSRAPAGGTPPARPVPAARAGGGCSASARRLRPRAPAGPGGRLRSRVPWVREAARPPRPSPLPCAPRTAVAPPPRPRPSARGWPIPGGEAETLRPRAVSHVPVRPSLTRSLRVPGPVCSVN